MAAKFLTMLEKALVTKESKKEAVKERKITDSDLPFKDLVNIRMQASQERLMQLEADGFSSQVAAMRKKIEEDCLDEVSKLHGFKKIKSSKHAFSSNIITNFYRAFRTDDRMSKVSFCIWVPSIMLSTLLVLATHLPDNSLSQGWCIVLGMVGAVGFLVTSLTGFIGSHEAGNFIRERSWSNTDVVLTPEQISAVQRARTLNIFDSIMVAVRFERLVAIIGKRQDNYYKIL